MFMDGIGTVHRGDDCSMMSGTSGGKTHKLEVIQWCWKLESFGGSSHIWHLGWAVKKTRFLTNSSTHTCPPTPNLAWLLTKWQPQSSQTTYLTTQNSKHRAFLPANKAEAAFSFMTSLWCHLSFSWSPLKIITGPPRIKGRHPCTSSVTGNNFNQFGVHFYKQPH